MKSAISASIAMHRQLRRDPIELRTLRRSVGYQEAGSSAEREVFLALEDDRAASGIASEQKLSMRPCRDPEKLLLVLSGLIGRLQSRITYSQTYDREGVLGLIGKLKADYIEGDLSFPFTLKERELCDLLCVLRDIPYLRMLELNEHYYRNNHPTRREILVENLLHAKIIIERNENLITSELDRARHSLASPRR